jgi:hypothetical protein
MERNRGRGKRREGGEEGEGRKKEREERKREGRYLNIESTKDAPLHFWWVRVSTPNSRSFLCTRSTYASIPLWA